VLLGHPGGPFWRSKDAGAWFIPKGEVAAGEPLLAAAKREFAEETGLTPNGPFLELGAVKHKSGKIVHAWAFEGDCNPAAIRSNTFAMEWPPHSGRQAEFPEIDQARFFSVAEVEENIHSAEFPLIKKLSDMLHRPEGGRVVA
jgi:predicted NUDIX family NTP pyrophosphohydrolase